MIYLKKFTLLDEHQEHNIVCYKEQRKIFNNYYPLHIFSNKSFKNIDFDKITIFLWWKRFWKNHINKYYF